MNDRRVPICVCEKAGKKSLIENITSNPLIVAVLGSLLGSGAAH